MGEKREKDPTWFSVRAGVLIPPSEYESVQLALQNSHPTYVEYSERLISNRPCVAIGEYHRLIARLPKAKEMLCVMNTKSGLGYEAINISLLFFWAFNEEKGGKELIVWCYSSHSDEGRRWIALSSTEWRTTPLGLHAVRRFKNVEAAKLGCPVENLVILPSKAENGWTRFMVHSPFDDASHIATLMRSLPANVLGIPEHTRLPISLWDCEGLAEDFTLERVCPCLMDEWSDPEEGKTDIPCVKQSFGSV
ncbi:MAG: hypothetical protein WC776_03680 [Patescibacteria group bacterium]|jgi:hypothetical protein